MKKFVIFDSETLRPMGFYESDEAKIGAVQSDGREFIHAELKTNVDPQSCQAQLVDNKWWAVSL